MKRLFVMTSSVGPVKASFVDFIVWLGGSRRGQRLDRETVRLSSQGVRQIFSDSRAIQNLKRRQSSPRIQCCLMDWIMVSPAGLP
jgi:hypothetical protein